MLTYLRETSRMSTFEVLKQNSVDVIHSKISIDKVDKQSNVAFKLVEVCFLIFSFTNMGNDHEVEFHEIEIQLFQKVEFSIMRSKFNLFMRSNLYINI